MKRGFTIIELLVASLLLGILTTILTMIFNQSSLAWQVGLSGISNMSGMREDIGKLREGADNAFVYGSRTSQIVGLWDYKDKLRNRACVTDNLTGADASSVKQEKTDFFNTVGLSAKPNLQPSDFKPVSVNGTSKGGYQSLYVNVKSGGPNNDINDYMAIWSSPDDPNEWN